MGISTQLGNAPIGDIFPILNILNILKTLWVDTFLRILRMGSYLRLCPKRGWKAQKRRLACGFRNGFRGGAMTWMSHVSSAIADS